MKNGSERKNPKGEKKEKIQEKKRSRKRGHILILAAGVIVPVFCLLAVYLVGASYYRSRFLNGTVIDRVDVSGMTIPELEEQIQRYSLKVIERQADGTALEEEILGKEIGISYLSTEPLQVILQGQNSFLWFLKRSTVYETEAFPFYEESALEERVGRLRGFQKEFIKEPTDAYISDYVKGSGFELVAENQGNRLNQAKTMETLKAAVDKMEKQVDLDKAGCYEKPEITLEDAALQNTFAKLQNYANVAITYTFGTKKEVLDGDTFIDWITVDGTDVTFDRAMVEEYVSSLRKKYDTIFHQRKFLTSYGQEVTIDRGDYGWWMDTDQETEELIDMLRRGESGERGPVYRQKAASYETPDYGNSYVEINLTAQHLFLYQDGECVLESDFVSGNPSRGNETPTGIYGITYKERNATLKGENYRTPVSFWMPFNNNVGMHDASWRSEFGGNIYKTNGSHGCINLPYSIAQQIYDCVEKDTPVICYHLPGTEPPQEEEPVEPGESGEPAQEGEGVPEEAAGEPQSPAPEMTTAEPQAPAPDTTASEPQSPAPETTEAEP